MYTHQRTTKPTFLTPLTESNSLSTLSQLNVNKPGSALHFLPFEKPFIKNPSQTIFQANESNREQDVRKLGDNLISAEKKLGITRREVRA